MKLPQALIEKAAAKKDEIRYYLHAVNLDLSYKDRAYMVASDGHILVAAPVSRADADEIGAGLISLDSIKEARANGGLIAGSTSKRVDGTFPKWRQIVPKHTGRAMPCDVAVNVDLLKRAQDALCPRGVTKWPGLMLWFSMAKDGTIDPHGPILCRAFDDRNGAFAVVMPMHADRDVFGKVPA